MATAKKPTAKKTVAKKSPIKKKAASKKTSAKSTSQMRSFRVAPDVPAFTTFKITKQTVYWIILVSFIIFMQMWILALQIQTSTFIENQITSLQSGN